MQPSGSALRAGEGRHRPESATGAGRSEATTRERFPLALALTAWGPQAPLKISRRLTLAEGGKRSAPAGGSAKRPLPWDVGGGTRDRVRRGDRLRGHPQERQHSADEGGKAGPSAPGEEHKSVRARDRCRTAETRHPAFAGSQGARGAPCLRREQSPTGYTGRAHPLD